MIFIFEFILLLLIFGIAEKHARVFEDNKKVSWFFHAGWGLVYFIPAWFISFIMYDDILVGLSFLFTRFAAYNPILNKIRDKDFFYLSVQGENPSWFDRIELKWKDAYPYVWAASLAGFIALQVILYQNWV